MTSFNSIMPVLRVADLERAVDRNTRVFAFETAWRAPNDGGGENGMRGKVKDAATIVWPLAAMEYGTVEFGIRDPDGYTLAFAETAP